MRGLGETGEMKCGSETRVTDRRDRTESTCLRDSRACAFSYDLNIYATRHCSLRTVRYACHSSINSTTVGQTVVCTLRHRRTFGDCIRRICLALGRVRTATLAR